MQGTSTQTSHPYLSVLDFSRAPRRRLCRMIQKNPVYQLTRFALMGIPQDAVCSVDVTNQCNLRCHHCYFFEHEQPENLAVERWRNFFEQLKSEGFPFFSCSWVGGEPLMRQEIIEMGSQYFRRNMVVTNGTIRIPDW